MKIILASKSPRRVDLLSKYISDFEIKPAEIEEKIDESLKPEITVMTLAYEKGYSIAKDNTDAVIIAADTMVYYDRLLGKPENREDAFMMLRELSGTVHKVVSGIALICLDKKIKVVDSCTTEVRFRDLSDEQINRYLDTEEYVDKAGSYGIQGKGELLCDSFSGSYSNVVGLPMTELDMLFEKYINKSLMEFR